MNNLLPVYIIQKKRSCVNPSFEIFRLATNSFTGNWKPGGEKFPIRTTCSWEKQETIMRVILTPPLSFGKLRKVGLTLISR